MKFRLFVFASLAVLFAGCARERLHEIIEKGEQIVTISATILQDTDTRVSYDDGTRKLAWESGDRLLLAGYDGETYKGSSIFNHKSGDQFTGMPVEGASTYKVYYPASAVSLDAGGNLQAFASDFWQQTQNGDDNTAHLGGKFFLTDETPKAVDASFSLALKSSVLKFNLSNIPGDIGTIKKLVWMVEATEGKEARYAGLDISGTSPGATSLTAYLAFDPSVMKVAAGGEFKITLIGDKSYDWSKTVASGKDYAEGTRYTATVNEGTWNEIQTRFCYTIQTEQDGETHSIFKHSSSLTNPANLTINWGDGSDTTIVKGVELPNQAIASHKYASAGNYTVTILSDQADPTQKQMPQISFYCGDENKQLKTILTPFPNMGATNFSYCLYRCTGLQSVPADLFRYNTQATNFRYCLYRCTGLQSVPADLFKYNTQATDFVFCFFGCTGLQSIPADLFKYNTQATNFSQCFYRCTALQSVPADLFRYNTQATNFSYCFYDCTVLQSVPADLFKYNTQATNFSFCFRACTGLQSVPADLFRYNTLVTNFSYCFYACTGLESVPADLFKYNTQATNFSFCFRACTGLQSVPADLFRYNTLVTNFSYCFYACTGLESVPADLFKYNTQATNFSFCFCSCKGLQSVPADLFRYNTQATNFSYCFCDCTELQSVPADLFSYNTQATNFLSCFKYCTQLTLIEEIFPKQTENPAFFDGRTMDFTECFRDVGTYATQGTAPELWKFNGSSSWTVTDCFTDANVSNYDIIPADWGGGGS